MKRVLMILVALILLNGISIASSLDLQVKYCVENTQYYTKSELNSYLPSVADQVLQVLSLNSPWVEVIGNDGMSTRKSLTISSSMSIWDFEMYCWMWKQYIKGYKGVRLESSNIMVMVDNQNKIRDYYWYDKK